ncbi:hypothetical protein GCM10023188_36960 [Pontibacter saemangeumensis]|uniref:Glycosyl transferase family 1 domain-containing protein n=1 Tax=Pontibacter saemangeumensis TaxID=1084525 RepID=A0ABP8M052_9BACT
MAVLVDSLFVNNSGGKILLDYLVEELESREVDVFYVFDERCRDSFSTIPAGRRVFLEGNIKQRHFFYKANQLQFTKVLCLGNIPPTIRLKAEVLTYLQQLLYFNQPLDLGFKKKCKLYLKIWLVKRLLQNTDYWGVQSENVSSLMEKNWGVSKDKIRVLPFYPPLSDLDKVIKCENKYLYVSGGNSHKNHYRLIDAFERFNRKYPEVELHLTISEKFPDLLNYMKAKTHNGVKIINHGFIQRHKLANLYKSSKFVIYPSLAESFGLGLVEAIELGCNIIASDLPFVHAVCEPSLVFEPLDTDSIFKALIASKISQIQPSSLKADNKIDTIISFLAHETNTTVIQNR